MQRGRALVPRATRSPCAAVHAYERRAAPRIARLFRSQLEQQSREALFRLRALGARPWLLRRQRNRACWPMRPWRAQRSHSASVGAEGARGEVRMLLIHLWGTFASRRGAFHLLFPHSKCKRGSRSVISTDDQRCRSRGGQWMHQSRCYHVAAPRMPQAGRSSSGRPYQPAPTRDGQIFREQRACFGTEGERGGRRKLLAAPR